MHLINYVWRYQLRKSINKKFNQTNETRSFSARKKKKKKTRNEEEKEKQACDIR